MKKRQRGKEEDVGRKRKQTDYFNEDEAPPSVAQVASKEEGKSVKGRGARGR